MKDDASARDSFGCKCQEAQPNGGLNKLDFFPYAIRTLERGQLLALIQRLKVVRFDIFFFSYDWKCLLLNSSHYGLALV